MRERIVNGRWVLTVPNSIADWDAPSGDPSLGTGWEAQRLQSMQEHLRWGDVVFDIGTEHGWLAAIIAREFVGPQNMVLMEPSPEFWPNIRLTWEHNGFADPLACWAGFVGAETSEGWPIPDAPKWPAGSEGQEHGPNAYRYINTDHSGIPTITVDDMQRRVLGGRSVTALNIDVEGAELLVLKGAEQWMKSCYGGQYIWVSIHPDLMERDFGSTKAELIEFVMSTGPWYHEHINTDHEEHHVFSSNPF